MQNITKMRIIHSAEFNAEKEYLKTFFDYIGLLVYDEKILDFQYKYLWYEHLKRNNERSGVDIVLNYYTNDNVPVPPYNKRIYLYFDLEKKICDISSKPLPSPKYLLNNKNVDMTKKDLRSKVLDLLIDEIWEDDIENNDAIKLIKECYIPKNEDSDLFYILQAIYSYLDVSDSYIIRAHNSQMEEFGDTRAKIVTSLFLDNYVEKFFSELWRVQCSLKHNNSPYAIYTTINNSNLLLTLYFNLSEYEKKHFPYISHNNTTLQINSDRDISHQIYNLVRNYPWFTKAMLKMIEMGIENQGIYNHLLDCISKSPFPVYYASVYNVLGYKYLNQNRNYKEIVEMFSKTLEIDPSNYDANFRIGLLTAGEGKLKTGESYLKNILTNIGSDNLYVQNNSYYNLFSLSELIKSFQIDILISKINLNSNREHSMRGSINEAFLYAECYEDIPLIQRIADNDEKAYQDFMQYHKYSAPVYALYSFLKPWVNDIIYDHATKSMLQMRLSKWK